MHWEDGIIKVNVRVEMTIPHADVAEEQFDSFMISTKFKNVTPDNTTFIVWSVLKLIVDLKMWMHITLL